MQDSARDAIVRRTAGIISTALIALSALAASPAAAAPADTHNARAVVAAVAARTTQITGYTADLSLHIALHSFPFIRVTIHGDMRYRQPGEYQVNMHTLPALARAFSNVSGDAGDPDLWLRKYDIAIDDGMQTQGGQIALRLTQKTPGEIDHAEAFIDTDTMTVARMEWHYRHGGTIAVDDHYAQVGDLLMVDRQTAQISMPDVRATATAEISGYAIQTVIAANGTSADIDK